MGPEAAVWDSAGVENTWGILLSSEQRDGLESHGGMGVKSTFFKRMKKWYVSMADGNDPVETEKRKRRKKESGESRVYCRIQVDPT